MFTAMNGTPRTHHYKIYNIPPEHTPHMWIKKYRGRRVHMYMSCTYVYIYIYVCILYMYGVRRTKLTMNARGPINYDISVYQR